jgi:hypothetical protein
MNALPINQAKYELGLLHPNCNANKRPQLAQWWALAPSERGALALFVLLGRE